MVAVLLAFIAGLSDIAGGLFALRKRMNFSKMRYIVAFASGTMLAAVFFEMLPAIDTARNYWYLAAGFFLFYALEKAVTIHACGEKECVERGYSWVNALGMASDNLVDGMGIAVSYLTNPALGIAVAVAVAAHELPQGMAGALILRKERFGRGVIVAVLGMEALLYPVGAALSVFVPRSLYSAVIAFVAGAFLYIAATDLLPHSHRRYNIKIIATTLAGAAFVLALGKFVG